MEGSLGTPPDELRTQRRKQEQGKEGPASATGGSYETGTTSVGGSSSHESGSFECNICLELAHDPVITLCGHLFCWPCLYKWMNTHTVCKECPVCKAGVEEDKVIPLYGRGNPSRSDPRKRPVPEADIPHRPPGQRTEPVRSQVGGVPNFNFMSGPTGPYASAQIGNFTFSAGFGLFPSLLGAWQFQTNPLHRGGPPPPGGQMGQQTTAEQQQQAFLSRMLLTLGCFVIICILFFP